MASRSGVLTAWICVNDAEIANALARESFDAVTLDMQHGRFHSAGAAQAILVVALAGKPTIVRIPVGDFACASRLADAGAAATIAPMINGADDAAPLRRIHEIPATGAALVGARAAAAPSAASSGPAYLHSANAMTLAIAMVETREALDALDEILTTPGIDGVFVGPYDLSIALTAAARLSIPTAPRSTPRSSRIVARARAARKVRRDLLPRRRAR